jgi:hypothetical protein
VSPEVKRRRTRTCCQQAGCTTRPEGDGNGGKAIKCTRHGGGPRCQKEGCTTTAKGDRKGGKAIHCIAHGGGARCQGSTHYDPTETPHAPYRHGGKSLCWSCHNVATGGNKCKAIRREHLVLGHLVSLLPEMLGVSAEGLQSFHHDKPVRTCHTVARPDLYFLWPGRLVIVIEFDENNHTDRTTKSEMQHLQVIKDWASNQHGVSCLKVVRVNEYRDTHGRRVRLFKQSATGAATGLPDGQPKREKVWVPTDAFLPCMDQVSKIVAPWIVAGQGKGEFPEAFNQIGMHTDVV